MMTDKTEAQLLKEIEEATKALTERREELTKRNEAKKDKLNKNLDKIKAIVASCGVKGRIVIDIPENGDITVSVGEIKTRKASSGNGNGRQPNQITAEVNRLLEGNKKLTDSEISTDLLSRGIVHTAGQVFGAANRWRHKNGLLPNK